MKNVYLIVFAILWGFLSYGQKSRTFTYYGQVGATNDSLKATAILIGLSIIKNAEDGTVIYEESHTSNTDSNGIYHIEIGGGEKRLGQFDSIVWSEGSYYIKTLIRPVKDVKRNLSQVMLVRSNTELDNEHIQGTDSASLTPTWGITRFANSKNRRPKKITVDLTTSYINQLYPADTYPIYRHYEWSDPERDGLGNSFTISYSENTTNAFAVNTTKLGEVRLYATAFQELLITSTASEITVSITEPVPVSDHGRTFEIKGPWKYIYFIEW